MFFLHSTSVNAQSEAMNWYFGNAAGLSFSTSPPSLLLNGVMTVGEGCATISDATGNVLFYSDGMTVWDKTHSIMANGSGLLGGLSPSSGCVILKMPGNNSLYYLFTIHDAFGSNFRYNVIDISLAAGNGSVVTKNVNLFVGNCTEKLAATKHCNGIDYWIVIHEASSNSFRSFQLSSTGINTVAVVSNVGSASAGATLGCMKISPNGKKLGFAISNQGFEMYDFDASTGQVSNFIFLGGTPLLGNWAYGCEFSPNSNIFYGSVYSASGPVNSNRIYQWDLCAGSNTAISASSYTLLGSDLGIRLGMQLAVDGKIYVTRSNSVLSAITSPNSVGIGCGFIDQAFNTLPRTYVWGLPNFMSSYFLQQPNQPPYNYTISNCSTVSFSAAPSVTSAGCFSNSFSLTSTAWDFGDPASGPANTSTLSNPIHIYSGPGSYTANRIYYYSCGGGTDTVSQIITILGPTLSVSSTSINCANLGSATVTAGAGIGPYTYTWLPVVQTGSTAINLTPGSHTVLVYDQGYNCTFTNSINFLPLIPLSGTIVATPSITCNGASTGTAQVVSLQGGSGNQSYLWFNGTQSFTTAFTNSLSAGLWSVNVTDALTGCQVNQSFFISQPPALSPTLSISTPTICAGSSAILSATNSGGTPGYTYLL